MALEILKWNKESGIWQIPVLGTDKLDLAYVEIKTVNGSSLSGSGDLTVTDPTKQPALVSGTNIKTINSSSLLGSGNLSVTAPITQVEVDFGTIPLAEQIFSIANADAIVGSKVIATLAYEAPTSKDLDEIEMDDLVIKCGGATTGFFNMLIKSVDGSYLADKFKINYIIA